jgi:hypothetical protein
MCTYLYDYECPCLCLYGISACSLYILYILTCFVLCLKYVCKSVLICVNLYVSFSKFVYVCDWYVTIFVKDYLHPKVCNCVC